MNKNMELAEEEYRPIQITKSEQLPNKILNSDTKEEVPIHRQIIYIFTLEKNAGISFISNGDSKEDGSYDVDITSISEAQWDDRINSNDTLLKQKYGSSSAITFVVSFEELKRIVEDIIKQIPTGEVKVNIMNDMSKIDTNINDSIAISNDKLQELIDLKKQIIANQLDSNYLKDIDNIKHTK